MGPAVLQKPEWGIKNDSGSGLHGLEEAPALLAISHTLELVVPAADNCIEVLLTELLQESAVHVLGLLHLTLQALLKLQPQGRLSAWAATGFSTQIERQGATGPLMTKPVPCGPLDLGLCIGKSACI